MIFVCSKMGEGTTGFSVECCFCVMYVEWNGVCNFVVISAVEVVRIVCCCRPRF